MSENKTTGKEAARNASKVLRDPTATRAEKSAAGSALSQVAKKKTSRKKSSKK